MQGGRVLDYLDKPNRKMCSLYLSLLDQYGLHREKFGDSNIDFWIWVQATDRVASFRMKTEIMKLLHGRFKLEGIEINYPVRHIILPEGEGPSTFPPIAAGNQETDGESAS